MKKENNPEDSNKPEINVDNTNEAFKLLMEKLRHREPTIAEHYGFKEKDFDMNVNKMLCDLVMNEERTKVKDKWFSKLDAEGRLNVMCFAQALFHHKNMVEHK